MDNTMDPISVTAYLRDLVKVFVEGANNRRGNQAREESEAIDDCFQLFLGRNPTTDEKKRIIPW